jgi:hypothetical protein
MKNSKILSRRFHGYYPVAIEPVVVEEMIKEIKILESKAVVDSPSTTVKELKELVLEDIPPVEPQEVSTVPIADPETSTKEELNEVMELVEIEDIPPVEPQELSTVPVEEEIVDEPVKDTATLKPKRKYNRKNRNPKRKVNVNEAVAS